MAEETFRTFVLDELTRRQWSQAQLAKLIGVAPVTLSRWLMAPSAPGHRVPKAIYLPAIADALGVDRDRVMRLLGFSEGRDRAYRTDLQRQAFAIIESIPDDMLATVVPMLRALNNRLVQNDIRETLKAWHGSDEDPVFAGREASDGDDRAGRQTPPGGRERYAPG